MAEEAFGRVVEASRKLYAKGVDISHLVGFLRENADLLVENADRCFVYGAFFAYAHLDHADDEIWKRLDEAHHAEKITLREFDETVSAVREYRTAKEREAFKKMEEKCGCKWVWRP